MNAKIERVSKDIQKAKEKISEFQAKLRELEKQKTELENTEIVDAVRGMDISLTDLATLLKAAKSGGTTSGQASTPTKLRFAGGPDGPKLEALANTEKTEENEDEE